jgi:hypothetical protein
MLTAIEEEAVTAATTNVNDVITIARTTSLLFSITCKYTKKCFIIFDIYVLPSIVIMTAKVKSC